MLVCFRNLVTGGADQLADRGIAVCFCRDQGHVAGCGVVIHIRQPVAVGEMTAGTTQRFGGFIHFVNECLVAASHVFSDLLRNGIGAFIGGFQHHGIQALLQGQCFPHVPGDAGAFCLVDRVLGKLHGFLQTLTICHSHVSSQDLGNACRISSGVSVFAVQKGAGIKIHHHRAFGIQFGRVHAGSRPAGRPGSVPGDPVQLLIRVNILLLFLARGASGRSCRGLAIGYGLCRQRAHAADCDHCSRSHRRPSGHFFPHNLSMNPQMRCSGQPCPQAAYLYFHL